MKCSKTLSICAGAKGEGVLSASLQGLGARERGLILLCVDVTFTVSLRHARQSPNLLGMQRWEKKKKKVPAVGKPGPELGWRGSQLTDGTRFISMVLGTWASD